MKLLVVDIETTGFYVHSDAIVEIGIALVDTVTKEILQTDFTVYMNPNQIFKIRYPNKDIRIRVKTLGTTTF